MTNNWSDDYFDRKIVWNSKNLPLWFRSNNWTSEFIFWFGLISRNLAFCQHFAVTYEKNCSYNVLQYIKNITKSCLYFFRWLRIRNNNMRNNIIVYILIPKILCKISKLILNFVILMIHILFAIYLFREKHRK